MFDVNRITEFVIKEIEAFARKNASETFYGFAIDGNLLCLNSEEEFEKTLQNYQKRYGGYSTIEEIDNLKHNTGDWKYQGFSILDDKQGFDMESYLEHFHEDDEYQESSDYTKSMNVVILELKKRNAFEVLNRTKDFYAIKVEHNY